jgi:hypothetical protein
MAYTSQIQWKRISAEGAAIVVSILLAFSIQAWWDDRNELKLEQRLLAALLVEFEQNGELLRQAREEYERRYVDVRRVLELMDGDPAEINEKEFDRLVGSMLRRQTFHLESGAHDGLLAAGELSLIRDEVLRNRLAAWPSYAAEWSEEQEFVFSFVAEVMVPYLAGRVRLRNVRRTFPPFPDGTAPPLIAFGPSEAASLAVLSTSLEFDNLVYRRAQGLWHAMRDGETLRVHLAEIVEQIRQNLDE